jgi:hypothetical protein
VILLFGTFVKGDKDGVVRLESGVEHHIQQPTVAFLPRCAQIFNSLKRLPYRVDRKRQYASETNPTTGVCSRQTLVSICRAPQ